MALTDSLIRTAKAAERPTKLYDERGLYLLITPLGSRLWRFKYRFEGREKLLGLGQYPDVSLKQARTNRDGARTKVATGVDPSAERQAAKAAQANTLRGVATEYLGKQKTLKAATIGRIRDRLNKWILPTLGQRPVSSLRPADLLPALKRVRSRGAGGDRSPLPCGRVTAHALRGRPRTG